MNKKTKIALILAVSLLLLIKFKDKIRNAVIKKSIKDTEPKPDVQNEPTRDVQNEGLSSLVNEINPEIKVGVFYGGTIKFDEIGKLKSDQSENQIVTNIIKSEYNIIELNAAPPVIWYDKGLDSKGNYKMYFGVLDDYVNFANDNGIDVMFACGLGGTNPGYTPYWIQNGNYNSQQLSEFLNIWFTTILNRYKGRVKYAIISGEAILGIKDGEFIFDTRERITPTPLKNIWLNLGWYKGKKHTFPRYLIDILKISNEIGGYEFIYNENSNSMVKSRNGLATYELILALREEGLRVDGVGMQLHCTLKNGILYEEFDSFPFDFDSFQEMIKIYYKSDIDVFITEFDINILNPNPTQQELEAQAYYYAKVLEIALQNRVKAFITFGTSDKVSNHITKAVGYKTSPYLFDENYNSKPALKEMKKTLSKYL